MSPSLRKVHHDQLACCELVWALCDSPSLLGSHKQSCNMMGCCLCLTVRKPLLSRILDHCFVVLCPMNAWWFAIMPIINQLSVLRDCMSARTGQIAINSLLTFWRNANAAGRWIELLRFFNPCTKVPSLAHIICFYGGHWPAGWPEECERVVHWGLVAKINVHSLCMVCPARRATRHICPRECALFECMVKCGRCTNLNCGPGISIRFCSAEVLNMWIYFGIYFGNIYVVIARGKLRNTNYQ